MKQTWKAVPMSVAFINSPSILTLAKTKNHYKKGAKRIFKDNLQTDLNSLLTAYMCNNGHSHTEEYFDSFAEKCIPYADCNLLYIRETPYS